MPTVVNTFKSHGIVLLSFFIVFICLLPILKTGLYSDDIQVFQERNGYKEFRGKNFIESANSEIVSWKHLGRFSPLALYLREFAFEYFTTVRNYKLFLLALNLLTVICFLSLLFQLQLRQLAPLFLLFYAVGIQFRVHYHDAYSTFAGMYQLLSICIFLTMVLYLQYAKGKKAFWLLAAVVLFTTAFLISEIGLSLLVFIFILCKINGNTWKRSIIALLPFIVPAIIYATYVFILRSNVQEFYSGVETNLNAVAMFRVLGMQLFALLPCSNLFSQYNVGNRLIEEFGTCFNIICVLILTLAFLLTATNLTEGKGKNQINTWLIALPISLILIPAMFIMPSAKYQSELWLGVGYLPVYIQNFGATLLLAYLVQLFMQSARPAFKIAYKALLTVAFVGIIVTFLFNSNLIKLQNYGYSFPRESLYRSIQNGILNDCEGTSTVLLKNDFFWNSADFYAHITESATGKNLHFVTLNEWPSVKSSVKSAHCFLLTCDNGDTCYTRLYSIDCNSIQNCLLVKCDTTYHHTILSQGDKHVLQMDK